MISKSVVTYTLEHCVKCMRCVKACPTSALSMVDNRVIISNEKCINCGRCIRACHSQGLLAKGSTLYDIENYDYTVCMIPSAMISNCKNHEEAEQLFAAIKSLGFDEVYDLTGEEGQVMLETRLLAESHEDNHIIISSICPVVNQLIKERYPMLLDNLCPINYPSEIAAKKIRSRLADKGNVGIFNFCECEAKLALAKYPYMNNTYETDHALSTVDIFRMIREKLSDATIPVSLCREGLQSCNPNLMSQYSDTLIADGYEKINEILDMTEFGLLNDFKLLHLFSCFNGCIGGHLLWGNSYLIKNNIDSLTQTNRKQPTDYEFDELYYERKIDNDEDNLSISEKMEFFKKVNEQLEHLPGYDCSACGMQTCRIMAEEIVKGNKVLDDCHILRSSRESNHEN